MECPICNENTDVTAESGGPDWYYCPRCQFSFQLHADGGFSGSGSLSEQAEKLLRASMTDDLGDAQITVNFTIKGANPGNKMPPDTRCPICDRLVTEHSGEQVRQCAHIDRDRRFPQLRDL